MPYVNVPETVSSQAQLARQKMRAFLHEHLAI
jgi:hypothetical protein